MLRSFVQINSANLQPVMKILVAGHVINHYKRRLLCLSVDCEVLLVCLLVVCCHVMRASHDNVTPVGHMTISTRGEKNVKRFVFVTEYNEPFINR